MALRRTKPWLQLATIMFLSLFIFEQSQAFKVYSNPNLAQFSVTPVAGTDPDNLLNKPTNMVFSPDGRIFVVEKAGTIRVIDKDGNLRREPWMDIRDRVNNAGDKGLLGMALHPNFPTTPHIYVSYPIDRIFGEPDENLNMVTQGVLARYSEVDGRGDPNTEFILIGKTLGSGFPSCHNSHMTGNVVFGLDGTLFASSGEGAHWDYVDDGRNFGPRDHECEDIFGAAVDIGSMRSQSLNNLAGKIVRVDPETGSGIGKDKFPTLVENPFYNTNDPYSTYSRIWDFGFRNPWRVKVRPDTTIPGPGTVYIGEPGWKCWEEINAVRFGGDSYGWPCISGPQEVQPMLNNATLSNITAAFCETNMKKKHQAPVMYWTREPTSLGHDVGFVGNCAGDMAFYTGTKYPSQYRGDATSRAVFFADHGEQWIRVFWVDENDALIESRGVQKFLDQAGAVTAIVTHPDTGDIHYLTIDGFLYRVSLDDGKDSPPVVILGATPTSGVAPINVQFSSDGSYDNGDANLFFEWDFGDNTPRSNDPNPLHTYSVPGIYTATLSVTDYNGNVANNSMTITANNAPPVVSIVTPNNLKMITFKQKELFNLTAQVTDDTTPAAELVYRWEFRIIHNNHFHPDVEVFPNVTLVNMMFSDVISYLERNSLEIYLTVTDKNGLKGTDMIRAKPEELTNGAPKAAIGVAPETGPAALTITADAGNSTDPDMDLMSFAYDWGDGLTGSGLVTRHTYKAPGTYTIKMTAEDPFGAKSTVTSQVTVTMEKAPRPVITPGSGSKSKEVTVTMTSRVAGATFYYTLDGTTPTTSSTAYTGPFLVKGVTRQNMTISAITVVNGMETSGVSTVNYNFNVMPTQGLLGYWSFDDITDGVVDGDRTSDCSANGNVAIIEGISRVEGQTKNAALFSGNSRVTVEDSQSLSSMSSAMTLSFWMKLSSNGPSDNRFFSLFSKKSAAVAPTGFDLMFNPSSKVLRLITSSDDICEGAVTSLSANSWNHIGVTVSNVMCTIYSNGQDVTSDSAVGAAQLGNHQDLIMGSTSYASAVPGIYAAIDELYLYGAALDKDALTVLASGTGERENRAPVVKLHVSSSPLVGKPFAISADVNDDCLPVDTGLTYSWTQTGGPATLNLVPHYYDPTKVFTTFPQPGQYNFSLEVSDGSDLAAGKDTVSVDVLAAISYDPLATPQGGYYPQGQPIEVSLLSPVSNAKIYYTLDGSEPTANSAVYTFPIILSNTTTLRAKAMEENTPLSAGISENYVFGTPTGDLALHYKFDGAFQSNKVEDSSNNKWHGTIQGTTGFQEGVFGQAIVFTQQGQAIRSGNVLESINGQLSISVWLQVANPDLRSDMRLISKKVGWEDEAGFALKINPGAGTISFVGSGFDTANGQGVSFGNGWHHIGVIVSEASAVIMFDGKDVTSTSTTAPITESKKNPLILASDGATNNSTFIGKMDDLRIFSKAISPERMRSVMQGSCGDGYCVLNRTLSSIPLENCGVCPQDCGATTSQCNACVNGDCSHSESFETQTLSGFAVRDLRVPFFPLRLAHAGVKPHSNFFAAQPSEGNVALVHGFDGCGSDSIVVSKSFDLDADHCTMQFDYRAQWDLSSTKRATQDRSFDVRVLVNGGVCDGNNYRYPILTAKAGETKDTGNSTATVDLKHIPSDARVEITFVWNVPECFTGPAFFQMDNIRFSSCARVDSDVCEAPTDIPGSNSEQPTIPSEQEGSASRMSFGLLAAFLIAAVLSL